MSVRLGAVVFTLVLLAVPTRAADEPFADVAAPFLKQHCIACHGEKRQEGGVRLDRLKGVEAGERTL
jgi:mono/diheme cytochrome c family protein